MSTVIDMNNFNPNIPYCAVSIVIPLYNAEKYIGDCLESLLAQTFQNFEVIIVNDCSTDKSCMIVENYMPKFNGRLNLFHMEKNSGSGALPRNKGLILSRGEYIFFVDADDLVTLTALEELYTLAKFYKADVVYCENIYIATADLGSIDKGSATNKPAFESENLIERVQSIMFNSYYVPPWHKFVRRNLMLENEIFFPNVTIAEDDIWTYGLVLYGKRFLRIPNAVYIQRQTENSILRKKRTSRQEINFWINPIIFGLKILDNWMNRIEFFKKNPQYRYAVLKKFVQNKFGDALRAGNYLPSFAFYDTIQQGFAEKLGEYDILVSVLLAMIKDLQKVNET